MSAPHTVIVGGTRGIGRALAHVLHQRGHALTVVGRHVPEPIEPALAAVRYIAADLAEPEQLLPHVRASLEAHGALTALVFLQRYRGSGDAWAGEIQTSLSATRFLIDRLAGEFHGGGAIVVVASNCARFIAPEQPLSYHVAKAGLIQLARYYAVALGGQGIRVNAVSPSAILKQESQAFFVENAALYTLYRRITPLQRMGTAAEVAEVIAFLCSEQASFITGQELTVDGGLSLALHDSLARAVAAAGS
jgi:NAD(P)-dependent dehydrogenase (short-subunit alcohol dehydrogenase family)